MRKILLTIAMAVGMAGIAQAQEFWKSGFTAGASYNFTTANDGTDEYSAFSGTTISGGYKHYLVKGLFIHTELSFYYEDHKPTLLLGVSNNGSHATETGLGLDVKAGYTLCPWEKVSLDIFTGPYYSYAWDMHETMVGDRHLDLDYNKSSLRWRFGVGVNVWKMSLRASYDLSMLKVGDGWEHDGKTRQSDVITIGLYYNF